MERSELKCEKCGKCCRALHHEGLFWTDNGIIIRIKNHTCCFLTEDNLCSIHENKPKLCKEHYCKK